MLPQPDISWKKTDYQGDYRTPIVCCVSSGDYRVFWEIGGWNWYDHPLQKGFLVEHHSPTYGWNTLEDVFELPLTSTVIENINFRGDYSGVNPIGEVLHVQGGYEYYLSFPYGMRRVKPDPQLHIKAFVCGLMRKGVPCQVIFFRDSCTFGYIP